MLETHAARTILVHAPTIAVIEQNCGLLTIGSRDSRLYENFGAIAAELNDRPRQPLGFKTPSQALAEVLR